MNKNQGYYDRIKRNRHYRELNRLFNDYEWFTPKYNNLIKEITNKTDDENIFRKIALTSGNGMCNKEEFLEAIRTARREIKKMKEDVEE